MVTGLRNHGDLELIGRLEAMRIAPGRDARAAAQGRARFLAQAESLRGATSPGPIERLMGRMQNALPVPRRGTSPRVATLMGIVLAATLVFFGAGATAYAAQDALPGDALFPVKTALEAAQVMLSPGQEKVAELRLRFAERRVKEMVALLRQERYEDLAEAADRFEREVQQATSVCHALAEADATKGESVATSLESGIRCQTERLSGLLRAAPGPARSAIRRALRASQREGELVRERVRGVSTERTVPPTIPPTVPPTVPPEPTIPREPPGKGKGPPAWVPVGPPDWVPVGPPDWVPVGPPDWVPVGPPDWVPASPPEDRPAKPPKDRPAATPEAYPGGPPDEHPGKRPTEHPGKRPTEHPGKGPEGNPGGPPTEPPGKPPKDPASSPPAHQRSEPGQGAAPPEGLPANPPKERPAEPPGQGQGKRP